MHQRLNNVQLSMGMWCVIIFVGNTANRVVSWSVTISILCVCACTKCYGYVQLIKKKSKRKNEWINEERV